MGELAVGELAVAMAVDSGVGVTSGVRAAPALGACMTSVVSATEVSPTWTTTERCGHSSAIRITAMTRTIRIAIRIPPTTILNTATTALRISMTGRRSPRSCALDERHIGTFAVRRASPQDG